MHIYFRKKTKDSYVTNISADEGNPSRERSQSLSMYRLKNIDPPTATIGSRISSRTQNLFRQYEVDIGNSKADQLKKETTKELREIRLQYQNSIIENEREIEAARRERIEAERIIKFSSNPSVFAT